VHIASGVRLITHNALALGLRHTYPIMQIFGRITVGDDTTLGLNAIILPGTVIGRNCFRISNGTCSKVHGSVRASQRSFLLCSLPPFWSGSTH
jgi:acetyltransferase-like isoleucine patch superfamily enzyme